MSYGDESIQPLPVIGGSFKLECVIICDSYHDFLVHTLPSNKFIFDQTIVVTSAEDKKTQRICEYHHVKCIRTDALNSRWGKFCKGDGINEGLAALEKADWVAHMDADIILPPQSRQLIENADLDKSMIYGIDRFIVKGYAAWDEFRAMPDLQHEDNAYIHTNAFPLGTRVFHDHANGWLPIGFFQLWHPGRAGISTYPSGHTDAGREDTLFAKKWPRAKRSMIPEIIGYHLESEDSTMAANWSGRKTKPFEHKKPAR
jgi:hypothetical protein